MRSRSPAYRELGLERGRRMIALPFSFDLTNHVSDADLAQLVLFAPLTACWRSLGLPHEVWPSPSGASIELQAAENS